MHAPTLSRPAAGWSLLTLVLAAAPAAAQISLPPERGGVTYQLGMPPVWKGHAGASFGWYRPSNDVDNQLLVLGHFGLMKDLGNPVVGIGAIGAEGYGGYRGDQSFDGGLRGLFSIPALHVSVGADWNIPDGDVDFLARLEIPFRRGGIFGRGTQVRADWLPGRQQTFTIGIDAPLWGRNIGRTRPQRDGVELRTPPAKQLALPSRTPGLDAAIDSVFSGARAIAHLTQPFHETSGGDRLAKYGATFDSLRSRLAGSTVEGEIAAYHAALERAFSIAEQGRDLPVGQGTERGRRLAGEARRILLDQVLLPYDRLLGQRKVNDGLTEFAAAATPEFARAVLAEERLGSTQASEAFYVFQRLLAATDSVRRDLRARWDDSRFVWLPLQLALRAEEHDTQEEMDRLIERATQRAFTRANKVWYVLDEQFQVEMARSVLRAERYHVLWIHDYRGLNGEKKPDAVAFGQTVDVYLEALIRRVKAYDSTAVLPEYFLFLDQHYFEVNKSRLFLRVLHDPMNYALDLPKGYEEWEHRLRTKQEELRAAVQGSRLLQTERSQYGDKWLRKRIRVQVNITNPADFSFASLHVAGIVPVPDNVMRDHRKIAFYDISEDDPYRGLAMYTGMGIGEHYTGANWEDRALMVQGPSALAVKDAARRLLEVQGFTDDEMPAAFRRQPKGAGYDAKVDSVFRLMRDFAAGVTGEVLEVHNETGFEAKLVNVEKAVLYSLMPSGSVIKVPDSLWQSYLYGSLLAGSALRGCRVLIVAPALVSAPSAGAPAMARAHDLFSALIQFQQDLGGTMAAAGGMLKTGLYAPKVGVGDLVGRLQQGRAVQAPWADSLYPANPALDAVFDSAATLLAGYRPRYLAGDDSVEAPKLHLKANLLLSGDAWEALLSRPEWARVVRTYLVHMARESQLDARERGDARDRRPEIAEAVRDLARAVDAGAGPDARSVSYFTIGSANMDYRSMVMDGEVMLTVTRWNALSGMIDFLILDGLCEWVETQEALDGLLPPVGGMMGGLSRFGKLAM
ncbi:MAG TPA: hypothetical protein VFY20_12495 [Gemmatimonadales bacterium]|nr:hypothetical protein [Gemmatimonadales bacterium]